MCTALAAVSAVTGGLQAIGSYQAARTQNQIAINNHKHQVQVRERNWFQTLSIWGAKKNKYYQDIVENDLAAQRGYSQAQVGLNKSYASAIQDNEKSFIEYFKNSGKLSASGRTGRSINRINILDIAKLERDKGRREWALTQSFEAYKENIANIGRQQKSARNELYTNVAFQPIPDVAPPAPVTQSATGALFMGLASAGLDAFSAYKSAQPQKAITDTNVRIPYLPQYWD